LYYGGCTITFDNSLLKIIIRFILKSATGCFFLIPFFLLASLKNVYEALIYAMVIPVTIYGFVSWAYFDNIYLTIGLVIPISKGSSVEKSASIGNAHS
jgi:hypothetical protein